ncbi:hypothetical protein BPT24_231 [Tenacibaculum phage pT24]|uniref:Uncharacterized protein n=1 Tax=Tenacibaculum phage pT24 TaxID=1880590 RepID=A0A1B4XX18_9CAUD|nr:hypothetical protein HYP10_gp297 [Tenacibaculum phage pT24]BAV39351.1 hypothetical protein BPT24_231 [Tenacibaculum phage pT24]
MANDLLKHGDKIQFVVYGFSKDDTDLNIEGENVSFSQLYGMYGCQINNDENNEEVARKCKQVADLLVEIRKLSKPNEKTS